MDDTEFKEAMADFLPALANTFFPDKNVVIDIKRDKPNTEPKKYLYIPPEKYGLEKRTNR